MKTLKTVIDFVASRTDLTNRADLLREINFAWDEIWNSDDLPNSLFEITMKAADDDSARITLPFFVGKIRAVKSNNRERVTLNTPRPYYHDETYTQSPFTHRILGVSPLSKSITNATRLKFTIPVANPAQFKVTVIGPDDNAAEVRDQIIFPVGSKEVWTTRQYTDSNSITKDILTDWNVRILGANGEDFGVIPNLDFAARNTVVQISDKCNKCCTSCYCFDVLYKKTTPVLYYDEQMVPYPDVLMVKTLEWITLPKDGQERKAVLYSDKTKQLRGNFNKDDGGITHVLDVGSDVIYSSTGWGEGKL